MAEAGPDYASPLPDAPEALGRLAGGFSFILDMPTSDQTGQVKKKNPKQKIQERRKTETKRRCFFDNIKFVGPGDSSSMLLPVTRNPMPNPMDLRI